MMAGTKKNRKYISVDIVHQKLPTGSANALLPFHALTGCDTTSYFFGHTKKTAWRVFASHFELLNGLGEGLLDADKISSAEKFVSLMYGVDVASVDTARRIMSLEFGINEVSDIANHRFPRVTIHSGGILVVSAQ